MQRRRTPFPNKRCFALLFQEYLGFVLSFFKRGKGQRTNLVSVTSAQPESTLVPSIPRRTEQVFWRFEPWGRKQVEYLAEAPFPESERPPGTAERPLRSFE
ncbi:hypothetical protein ALCH109712_02995 [Alkalicoccus chagannorensis]